MEIDSDLSRIAPAVDDEGKGILRVVQMGGNLAGNEIVDFNEDVNRTYQYCKAAISTQDHIRWECSFFASTRDEIDADSPRYRTNAFRRASKTGSHQL